MYICMFKIFCGNYPLPLSDVQRGHCYPIRIFLQKICLTNSKDFRSHSESVLVYYCCYNKLPKTQWLKTTPIEGRSMKSISLGQSQGVTRLDPSWGSGGIPFLYLASLSPLYALASAFSSSSKHIKKCLLLQSCLP